MKHLLLLTFILIGQVAAAANCRTLLKADGTNEFIAYFADLLEQGELKTQNLEKFVLNLKNGVLENPIPASQAQVNTDAAVHHSAFADYIESSSLNSEVILKWAVKEQEKRGIVQAEQHQTRKATEVPLQRIKMNSLSPTPFQRWRAHDRDDGWSFGWIFITPYMLADSPVTEWQWERVMGEKSKSANAAKEATWGQIHEFFERLNQLSKEDNPIVYEIIPTHTKGRKYRLPSQSDLLFVMSQDGKNSTFSEEAIGNLDRTVFEPYLSSNKAIDVATLVPWMSQNQEFFDFFRAEEWSLGEDSDPTTIYFPDLDGKIFFRSAKVHEVFIKSELAFFRLASDLPEKPKRDLIKNEFNKISFHKGKSGHITEAQWYKLMRELASHRTNPQSEQVITHIGWSGSLEHTIMNPDETYHMREGSRFGWIEKFIDRLNELSRTNDPLIYKLIKEHGKGDEYRLPHTWEMRDSDLTKDGCWETAVAIDRKIWAFQVQQEPRTSEHMRHSEESSCFRLVKKKTNFWRRLKAGFR